ncbi:MAG TPA: acyl-CoA dehydrogenase family protein [Crenalkalicoccus sp.]|nr:acyl-CoA dehydrogenase family protein [Crenalkalicoccus sp.]
MSETTRLLTATAERLFADHATRAARDAVEAGGFPEALWAAMTEAGLALAAAPEEAGGAALALAEVLALVRVAGAHAVPAPFVETWLAQHALAEAKLAVPEGPLTVAPVLAGDQPALAAGRLSGRLRRVPWARHARAIALVLAEGRTVLAGPPAIAAEGANQAGEPRDTVLLEETPVLALGESGTGLAPDALWRLGALFRANAMAGALGTVTQMALRYAGERVQFGRPIGRFQAVQHQIAVLAGQAAAARVAAEAAAASPGRFEIACAKLRVGEAATIGAGIAHQVHGAMGFTHEHPLHFFTRRLWSWRDEFGNEAEWATWIGRAARAAGGRGLWPLVADQPAPLPAGFAA